MRPPNFDDLNAFLAVAEHGNFTKAAAHFGVSSPTLTRMVQSLEQALNVRLLNRTTRSVALTQVGTHLVGQMRPIVSDYLSALESINSLRVRPAGILRLLVWSGAAQFMFLPRIPGFLAQYPEITIEISTDKTVRDIVEGHFDAGVQFGTLIDDDMIAVRICDALRVITVASPLYLDRHPRPKTPNELETHNCIRFRKASGAIAPWRFSENGQSVDVAVKGSLIVCETSLAIRAAVDGVGIARVNAPYVASAIAEGKLVHILEEWPSPADPLFLYYPGRRQIPAHLQALIDYFKRRSQEEF